MKIAHHAAIIDYAARLAPDQELLADPTTRAALRAGVQAADYYDDVVILGDSLPARFVAWTQTHVSGGTSLQHFGGRGYCLDADDYRPRAVDLTALDQALVGYDPTALPMPLAAAVGAPGMHALDPPRPWAHTFYPPAGALAEFYAGVARTLWRVGDRERALRCLAAAIHMLQDLCVPHHAICTIGLGHSQYEAAAWAAWRPLQSPAGLPLRVWRALRGVRPAALVAGYRRELAGAAGPLALAAAIEAITRREHIYDAETPIRTLMPVRACRISALATAAVIAAVEQF